MRKAYAIAITILSDVLNGLLVLGLAWCVCTGVSVTDFLK